MKISLYVFLSILIACNAASHRAIAHTSKRTSNSWQSWSKPEDVGFSSTKLKKVNSFIQTLDTTSMVIIVGGKKLFEYGDITEICYTASVRKSILAILYGNYVADGTIDLNMTLKKLGFDDIEGLTQQEKEATINDLLTARSGIYHVASNVGYDSASAPSRDSKKPGEYFLYNNWDFNAAGAIFEHLTKQNMYDALENLATNIGMEDFDRNLQQKAGDTTKSWYPAYYMWLSTRDMARIGYLMLRNGKWHEQQVIPTAWVQKIITPTTRFKELQEQKIPPKSTPFDFGYMWWIFTSDPHRPWAEGSYTAWGAYGQSISVFPKFDMVIAHKTALNKEAKDTWDAYMKDHSKQEPERNSVSMSQYLQILDYLFSDQ